MLCTALARRATAAGTLPAFCRLLPSVSAANLHGSAAAVEQLAVANAPARMEEVAQAVKEVMGEPDPHHIQLQQEAEQPLPLAALKFDDPQAAFKVGADRDTASQFVGWKLFSQSGTGQQGSQGLLRQYDVPALLLPHTQRSFACFAC
jgi:hypothetical protein